MIYDLKRSVGLRWLFDMVLHSSLEDLVELSLSVFFMKYWPSTFGKSFGKMFQHFKIVGCWSILRSGRKICELELTGTSLITVLLSVPYDMVTLKLWKWKIFFPTLKLKGKLNVDVVLLSVRYDMVSFSLRKCKKKFLNLNLSERWMLMYHCFVECPIWYGDNKDWENLWQVFDSFFNLRETFVVDVSLFCWVSHMM